MMPKLRRSCNVDSCFVYKNNKYYWKNYNNFQLLFVLSLSLSLSLPFPIIGYGKCAAWKRETRDIALFTGYSPQGLIE